jgi:hypothetical protein
MRRAKLVLAALSVTVAAFMAFAGPAMAVDCTHTNQAGVIECGKHDNRFLSEDRFFDHNDFGCLRCQADDFGGFFIPVFASDVNQLGCWEWSSVFERWEWEDDCD